MDRDCKTTLKEGHYLTKRNVRIMVLIARGWTAGRIGALYHVSPAFIVYLARKVGFPVGAVALAG